MLIRNARLEGYPDLVDLRLMHGAVQEIGVCLQKGLYESEMDAAGDELRPWLPDMPLPRRYARRSVQAVRPEEGVRPGTPEPLSRWRQGACIAWIDQHSAD